MDNEVKFFNKISGSVRYSAKNNNFVMSIKSSSFIIEKETPKTIKLEYSSGVLKEDINHVMDNTVLLPDILNRVSMQVYCYGKDEDFYIEKLKSTLANKLEDNMSQVKLRIEASSNVVVGSIRKINW